MSRLISTKTWRGQHMAKLEDAKDILKALGLPPKQQNDVAAYTLLALGGIPLATGCSRSTHFTGNVRRRAWPMFSIFQFIPSMSI